MGDLGSGAYSNIDRPPHGARRLHHAVYAVGHTSISVHGRYMAAVLACGPGAALSHRSEDLLLRANGHRGVGALRRAVAAWRPRYTRSELEDRFQDLLQAASLPSPVFGVLVHGDQHIHEVDTLWAARQLVVQLDGFAYHRTRRDRARDAATDADLELAGYQVVRLIWDDVTVISSARRDGFDTCSYRTRD